MVGIKFLVWEFILAYTSTNNTSVPTLWSKWKLSDFLDLILFLLFVMFSIMCMFYWPVFSLWCSLLIFVWCCVFFYMTIRVDRAFLDGFWGLLYMVKMFVPLQEESIHKYLMRKQVRMSLLMTFRIWQKTPTNSHLNTRTTCIPETKATNQLC